MKIRIAIITENDRREFSTGHAAIKYLAKHKAKSITMNNDPCGFIDIAELYQLELKEKRHNKAQGL